MSLRYTLRDAELWAAFSQDYNPVHFDIQYAYKLGEEKLSVHGMRALLDMKHFLTEALLANTDGSEAPFYTFTARMRKPVLCNQAYTLVLDEKAGVDAVSGKLLDTQSGSVCFTSKLATSPAFALNCEKAGGQYYYLDREQLLTLSERYPVDEADSARLWGLLDGILFRSMLTSPETHGILRTVLPEYASLSLTEVFSLVPVVQTHHQVCFSGGLLKQHTAKPQSGLYYTFMPVLIAGGRESGFVIQISALGKMKDQPVISTAITLKTAPIEVKVAAQA